MAAVTVHSDFRAQEEEICHCFHLFPFFLPWGDGANAMTLVFLIFSFKPAFSLSSFTLIKFFSSSLLSAIRVVSSAHRRLLIFLLPVLIPAYNSSSRAFLMMSTDRWMDKAALVHTHNRILLSYKKKHIWVCSTEVMKMNLEPINMEWSKSERGRQTYYIKAYTWNLERWYSWPYLQGSKGDTDRKNRLSDTVRVRWFESCAKTHTLPYVK